MQRLFRIHNPSMQQDYILNALTENTFKSSQTKLFPPPHPTTKYLQVWSYPRKIKVWLILPSHSIVGNLQDGRRKHINIYWTASDCCRTALSEIQSMLWETALCGKIIIYSTLNLFLDCHNWGTQVRNNLSAICFCSSRVCTYHYSSLFNTQQQ